MSHGDSLKTDSDKRKIVDYLHFYYFSAKYAFLFCSSNFSIEYLNAVLPNLK